MLSNVFTTTLRDLRGSIGWWALGLAAFAGFIVAFYPSIRDNSELEELLDIYPEDLMALMGISDVSNLFTGAGFVHAEIFGFLGPLLFIVFTIGMGGAAIAGEEGNGTLEILLTEPIARGRVVIEKWAAMAAATAGLSLVLWVVPVAGGVVVDLGVGIGNLAGATASIALLGLLFGTLALAVGCAKGSRGLATGVTAAVAVATYLLSVIGDIVEFMDPAKYISPFYYYSGSQPLINGISLAHAATLAGAIAVLAGAAYVSIERRDIAT